MRNRNIINESFGQSMVDQVLEKGQIVPDFNKAKYRKDNCGAQGLYLVEIKSDEGATVHKKFIKSN